MMNIEMNEQEMMKHETDAKRRSEKKYLFFSLVWLLAAACCCLCKKDLSYIVGIYALFQLGLITPFIFQWWIVDCAERMNGSAD